MSNSIVSPPSLPPPSDQIYTAPQQTAADKINEAIDEGVKWGSEQIGDGIDWQKQKGSEAKDFFDALTSEGGRKAVRDCFEGVVEGAQGERDGGPDADGYN